MESKKRTESLIIYLRTKKVQKGRKKSEGKSFWRSKENKWVEI